MTEIEDGIPIPGGNKPERWQMDKLRVGESIWVAKLNERTAACNAARRQGVKYVARAAVKDCVPGHRIWRVAERPVRKPKPKDNPNRLGGF